MSNHPNIVHVTDADFGDQVLNHDGYVLVDFWAAWCGPCKMLEPEIEKLAEYAGDKLKIAKLNVDENPAIASQFQIMSIPTIMLVTPQKNEEGKKRSVVTMGFRPFPALKEWIEQAGFSKN